ncbi:MAG: hypothetical protein AMXMBFR4_07330 [Candidatus Hydrogenedentota bacterium]
MHRILIIDDEPVLRTTFQHLLEEHGHTVRTAADGQEGLSLCKEFRPDLVVTDIVMPQQDGFATVQELRRQFRGVPIIVMSGNAGPEQRRLSTNMGALFCLNKPVDYTTLLRLIDNVLSRSSGRFVFGESEGEQRVSEPQARNNTASD